MNEHDDCINLFKIGKCKYIIDLSNDYTDKICLSCEYMMLKEVSKK